MRLFSYITVIVLSAGQLLFADPTQGQTLSDVHISLNVKKSSLKQTLDVIRQKSGFQFVYNDDLVSRYKEVTIEAKDLSLTQILDKVFSVTKLTYLQQNKTIIIMEKPLAAQQKAAVQQGINGKIVDENGEMLPGATITLIELKKVGIADNKGEFQFAPVPAGIYTLEARMIGYNTTRLTGIKVEQGKATSITINMIPAKSELSEVVVTALGIKREEKALGYSITTLNSDQINNAVSNNWTDALSGKVAGLNLLRSNGGPAGSDRIILRGENSLSGTTEALIVLDGVVISSSSGRATGNGTAYIGDDSPTDYGTALNDINPQDIESISVLKGPGATALYGARGAGGAIIITTKQANPKTRGMGISLNSSVAVESPSRWPDYQFQYGQGHESLNYYSYLDSEDGTGTQATSSAFGPKFDGQNFYQFDPNTFKQGSTRTPWVPYKNSVKGFFQNGITYTNNFSLEGSTKGTSARLSYTNLKNTWIIPNTGYDRNTLALSVNQKLSDKLQLAGKVAYTNNSSDNLPAVGYNNQTIMYWAIRQTPSADLNWLKQYWIPGSEGLLQNHPFAAQVDNPYLITYEMLNKQNRNVMTGNLQLNYSFSKSLSLLLRTSLDMSYDARSQQRPKDTQKYKQGMYRTQNIFNQEINSDFLLKYQKQALKQLDINLSLGGSSLRNKYQKDEIRAERLFAPEIFSFANSMDVPLAFSTKSTFGVTSLYGLASFGYKSYLYLDLTGRNDWSSTLVADNGNVKAFFYPSASLSAVISDMLKLPTAISYLKLRGSYAHVGSGGTTPYLTSYVYNAETNFPSGLTNPPEIANPKLRPESTTSYEFGTEFRIFKDQIGGDITVYQNNTKDQILRVPLDKASGYYYAVLNSGEVQNRGLEVALHGSPFKKANGFNWTINGTFTANRNKVLSLADSVQSLVLQTGPGGRGSIEARVGGNMGDMYGLGYLRSPDGQIVYNGGYPIISQTARYLGNIYPKWKVSIGNEVRYKQFRLNVLFDAQFGGMAYSHTYSQNASGGKLTSTIPGRYNGIIGDGVIQNLDGSYRKNDVVADDIAIYYEDHFNAENVEANLFSTDFIKFREARLDYSFKPALLQRLDLQKLNIGVYGRNLLIISNWPSFDPEFGTLNNGLIQSGFEIGQFPATRTFGVNLSVSF